MALDLSAFESERLTPELIDALLAEHASCVRPALERLWAYYRNPEGGTGSPMPASLAASTPARGTCAGHSAGCAAPFQTNQRTRAQAMGLPPRLRCAPPDAEREIVLENDIAWRIEVLPLLGRSFHFKPLASTGDHEVGQVIGEYTLQAMNENAHGVIRGLSTTV